MKKTLIPIGILGAGAAYALRRLQLAKSYDAAGLIPRGDKTSLALYLVCGLIAALILVLCLREPKGIQSPAGKNKLRGLLVIIAGLGLLASYLPPSLEGGAKLIVPILAFCAACAIVIEGVYHMNGAVGALLGGCVLSVYLAATLIRDYRTWSHDPLVADFCFPLLFLVAAMLASYHLAAFRVGRGKRRTAAFLVGCALLFAGPMLADGGWRTVLRTLAVCLYLIAEFWPYLGKPDPIPEPEPAAEEEAKETPEAIEEAIPEEIPEAAEEAVQEEIPEAVEEAVPEEITEAVEEAVPAEIVEAVEETAAEEIPQAADEIAPEE